jgi:hypothetical protein
MPEAKQSTSPTLYASSGDFRRIFHEETDNLYRLSFLLTADREKAEQCFVSGFEDSVKGSPVFKEWARSWARRTIIQNAVRVISPRPMEEHTPSRFNSGGKTMTAEQAEIAAVLEAVFDLGPFERFVYVMSVLETLLRSGLFGALGLRAAGRDCRANSRVAANRNAINFHLKRQVNIETPAKWIA